MALLNFRDVASVPGTTPLTAGRLFRSAQPFHLRPAEVDLVVDSGIRTIIDLRTPGEVVPPDWEPLDGRGVRVINVPLAQQVMAAGADLPGWGHLFRGEVSVEDYLGGFYVAIAEHAIAGLAEITDAVAAGEPVLLHCAAGKDRTGTAVALLLDLIGVPREAIVSDYLRTNDAADDILAQLSSTSHGAETVDPTVLPPGLHTAPEPAIRRLLAHLDQVGGGRAVLAQGSDAATLGRVAQVLTS
ncbi:hypothetical protein GIS00_19660 [Nakamurella sp. YIM 132087]|uniref:Tyrosine specific protein phosphatases domain-containing protein n=1 Tax=Nakamurella alba TaxID=2665158 RepID=A0A7K1FQ19_9ACTN|nr:tyrosine-protein phosphatase [Nakamurella alba]MTD16160.1 hypothetical protein [Nakamurella alba]